MTSINVCYICIYIYYVYLHHSRIELLMTTTPFPRSALCRSPVLGPKLRLVARSLNIRRTKAWRGRHARISCGPCGGMNEPMVGRNASWLVRSIRCMFLSWYEDERGKIEEWHSELTILTGEQRENLTLCIYIYTIWTVDDSRWMTARLECHVAPGRSIREITITRPGREDLRQSHWEDCIESSFASLQTKVYPMPIFAKEKHVYFHKTALSICITYFAQHWHFRTMDKQHYRFCNNVFTIIQRQAVALLGAATPQCPAT